ncbi:aspartate dehydrogenase [Candidatus Woesearchaeota archaeon]|nr:aspartate dehydrogenase [Candidatus Woesearchaeota archaeon]|tara:strand:- start:5882 stop:6670 length:789 start_codon:yes stop_codon:yes gene_type:complete
MIAGIIGCGNIGTELALFIDKYKCFELKYLCDIDSSNIKELQTRLGNGQIESSIGDLITNSELIIEVADKNAVKDILNTLDLDQQGKKLLIMSTGGIIENLNLFNKIKNCEIYMPSGAISGLDAIKSVSGKIKSLTLTTTKPVKGLENAPYLIKNNINITKLENKKIIFEGTLKEAIEGFPKNINVAATLFLVSKFDKIQIKIIADPKAKTNIHEIICTGDFGTITTKTDNLPSKNPKTSYLAVLSAIQTLRNIKNNKKIGS